MFFWSSRNSGPMTQAQFLIMGVRILSSIHSISKFFRACHTWAVARGPASSDVLWWMPIELPSPGVWAQVPSKDAESCAVLMESVLECLVRNMHMSRSLHIAACMTSWRSWTICATWPLGCRHHLMPAVIRTLTKNHNWRNGEIDSHLLVLSNWTNGFPRYCD